jgi:hypothetical protein
LVRRSISYRFARSLADAGRPLNHREAMAAQKPFQHVDLLPAVQQFKPEGLNTCERRDARLRRVRIIHRARLQRAGLSAPKNAANSNPDRRRSRSNRAASKSKKLPSRSDSREAPTRGDGFAICRFLPLQNANRFDGDLHLRRAVMLIKFN